MAGSFASRVIMQSPGSRRGGGGGGGEGGRLGFTVSFESYVVQTLCSVGYS